MAFKKIYKTSKNYEYFQKLPGNEKDECAKCKAVIENGKFEKKIVEEHKDIGMTTDVCPQCGCEEFYIFKIV